MICPLFNILRSIYSPLPIKTGFRVIIRTQFYASFLFNTKSLLSKYGGYTCEKGGVYQ